jgi:hypothetical protein
LQRLYRRLKWEGDHYGDGKRTNKALTEPGPSAIATLHRLNQAIGGSQVEQVESAIGNPHDRYVPTNPRPVQTPPVPVMQLMPAEAPTSQLSPIPHRTLIIINEQGAGLLAVGSRIGCPGC